MHHLTSLEHSKRQSEVCS